MSSNYELIFLHSIPFLAKVGEGNSQPAKSRVLYYYDAKHIGDGTEPIRVGLWNEDGSIRLDEDWKFRVQPRIDAWRTIISPCERGVAQDRAPKPSKPKRTSPKATTATATTAATTTVTISDTTTNTVVYPKNTKSRSRGVRKVTKGLS